VSLGKIKYQKVGIGDNRIEFGNLLTANGNILASDVSKNYGEAIVRRFNAFESELFTDSVKALAQGDKTSDKK